MIKGAFSFPLYLWPLQANASTLATTWHLDHPVAMEEESSTKFALFNYAFVIVRACIAATGADVQVPLAFVGATVVGF